MENFKIDTQTNLDSIVAGINNETGENGLINIFLEIGYLFGCAGQYTAAEQCFEGVIALEPRHIGGWLGLGNTQLMKGCIRDSQKSYKQALTIIPDDPAATVFLGELYLCTHRTALGYELLSSVLLKHPGTQAARWAKHLMILSREVAR